MLTAFVSFMVFGSFLLRTLESFTKIELAMLFSRKPSSNKVVINGIIVFWSFLVTTISSFWKPFWYSSYLLRGPSIDHVLRPSKSIHEGKINSLDLPFVLIILFAVFWGPSSVISSLCLEQLLFLGLSMRSSHRELIFQVIFYLSTQFGHRIRTEVESH